jgi:hypothetical protein
LSFRALRLRSGSSLAWASSRSALDVLVYRCANRVLCHDPPIFRDRRACLRNLVAIAGFRHALRPSSWRQSGSIRLPAKSIAAACLSACRSALALRGNRDADPRRFGGQILPQLCGQFPGNGGGIREPNRQSEARFAVYLDCEIRRSPLVNLHSIVLDGI